MKPLICLTLICLFACNTKEQSYLPAEDALDAGREFIQSCLEGDFSKAAFYTVADEENTKILTQLEKSYREKDKEGRQQFRTASINISEVKELTDSTTLIQYSNSFDKETHSLQVVKRNNTWLVNTVIKE